MDITVFPISMEKHFIFCVIAAAFFLLQFGRTKRWYQLVMTIAIPATLLIYINPEQDTLFYGVGIGEAVMLLLALILNIVQSCKTAAAEKAKKAAEEAESADAAPESDAPASEPDASAEAEAPLPDASAETEA